MIAFTAIVVSVQVVGVILVKQCIAAAASGVMVLIAVMTERCILVAIAVFCPYNLTASFAGSGMPLIAFSADYLTVYFLIVIILADKCSTVRAV
jgi:hypothetical protein